MIDRQTRDRIKTATIPEWVALDLLRDIDSAIRHRDAGSLRNFAREAALAGASGRGIGGIRDPLGIHGNLAP